MDKSSVCMYNKNRKYVVIKMKQPENMFMIACTQSKWEPEMTYYTGTGWSDDITDGIAYSREDVKIAFQNLRIICQNRCKSRIPDEIVDQFEDSYMSSKLDEGDM